MRSGSTAIGVEGVRAAAFRGKLFLALVAADASANSTAKLLPLLHAKGVTLLAGPDRLALGSAAGRGAVAAIGITDRQLADGIRRAAAMEFDWSSGEWVG